MTYYNKKKTNNIFEEYFYPLEDLEVYRLVCLSLGRQQARKSLAAVMSLRIKSGIITPWADYYSKGFWMSNSTSNIIFKH